MGWRGVIGLILGFAMSPCALHAADNPGDSRSSSEAREWLADANDRERRERKRKIARKERPLQAKSLPPPKAKPSQPRERDRPPRSR